MAIHYKVGFDAREMKPFDADAVALLLFKVAEAHATVLADYGVDCECGSEEACVGTMLTLEQARQVAAMVDGE
jgi:hypothetical protein